MQCIPNVRKVFFRLWTVWILLLAVSLTLADIFLSDFMQNFLPPLLSQLLRLALMIAALIARALVQPAMENLRQTETLENGSSSNPRD